MQSPQGWLTKVTSPGGLTFQTAYNDEGQPIRATDPRRRHAVRLATGWAVCVVQHGGPRMPVGASLR
ncbi:MAG: RHS repeat domain-containing protein [Caldilineaceae bacterium]